MHRLDDVVGQRVAVLDRVDAGVGGDARRLIRRRVRGDALADAMRLVDDHACISSSDTTRGPVLTMTLMTSAPS